MYLSLCASIPENCHLQVLNVFPFSKLIMTWIGINLYGKIKLNFMKYYNFRVSIYLCRVMCYIESKPYVCDLEKSVTPLIFSWYRWNCLKLSFVNKTFNSNNPKPVWGCLHSWKYYLFFGYSSRRWFIFSPLVIILLNKDWYFFKFKIY